MANHVISADGTRIAYDVRGSGEAIVLVGGLLCDRTALEHLAEALARELRVITYDRRGRGESGDTQPYGVARELEDLGALIAAAGGAAALYGHSSGAGLALNAAAHALPVTALVLHEPPYSTGDDESRRAARELAENIRTALASGRRQEAIRLFGAAAGMPNDMVKEFSGDPRRRSLAHTMIYDFEVMGEFAGGGIPEHLVVPYRSQHSSSQATRARISFVTSQPALPTNCRKANWPSSRDRITARALPSSHRSSRSS